MGKATKKIVIVASSLVLAIMLLVTPIIVVAGVVASPVVAIHDFFVAAGDVLFGEEDYESQVMNLIMKYFELPDTKKEIKNLYQPAIDKSELEISLNWLVIPNLLAGIEEVDETLINKQIKALQSDDGSVVDLEKYINQLRAIDPWKTAFGDVSTTTICGYVSQFNSYLGQEESLDIGDLKDKEFLYPLKEKAVVTSEFGGREIAADPSSFHTGIDLAYNGGNATTCGVPVYASMDGVVVNTEQTYDMAGANWGAIQVNNVQIWYLHLRDPFPLKVGDKVKKGDFVGYVGSTGLSTGCHLHYEVQVNKKPVNPRNFLEF